MSAGVDMECALEPASWLRHGIRDVVNKTDSTGYIGRVFWVTNHSGGPMACESAVFTKFDAE
jgi:hypothetical protein